VLGAIKSRMSEDPVTSKQEPGMGESLEMFPFTEFDVNKKKLPRKVI